MKIEQSNVVMDANHVFSSECETRYDVESNFQMIFNGMTQVGDASETTTSNSREERVLMMLESLIARVLELISDGKDKEAKVTDLREILGTDGSLLPKQTAAFPSRVTEIERKTRFTENMKEHESTDFSTTGEIRTADGRSLNFMLNLGMCRDFQCEREETKLDKVVFRDPLVINFEGNAAELSGNRFEFDLNADGKNESIYGLGNRSGYLAIDSNADGHINDGNELFGTRSGNGFSDLAKFDDDGNHWLDESDVAFSQLRIWQQDALGKEALSTLHDKGIGALFLGSTDTPFSLTDKDNRVLAQIRASGVYLLEDGRAGSLQQVDLAV